MRFHVLGLPHTVSSKEFNACAYTQKVVKFCKMMSARGHYIIHYGHEDSDVICNEHVSVIANEDWKIAYGDYDWRKNFFKFDVEDHAYKTFYKNAIEEVGKRKQPLDFILPFWGAGVRPICDAHTDMICVEPGIGYAGGHWARWKIFESYAIYHAYCGMGNVGHCNQDWYEVVIPNYFDLEDFDYSEEKDDYFLFLGRVFSGKGIDIAIQMTEKIGAKLIVAGQNPDNMTFPDHVEYIGYADVETRKKLLSRAKGFIIGSMYVEPFGGVQVEALLSGTPTITTDWGSFTENNIQGVTGYRCRTFEDFVNAGKNIDKINPADCRKFAEKFSLENVALMYEKYFQDVLNVHIGKGWYHIENDVANCDQHDDYELEKSYWNDCTNTFDEDLKHYTYAKYMGLTQNGYSFDVGGKSILDIGGGPASILLKTTNLKKGKVIDPIEYPKWTIERYNSKNIDVLVDIGENVNEEGWDEVWIYNCLQHVIDPQKIIENAKKSAKVLRIFEWINIPPHDGHPHCLTKENLDTWIGGSGNTIQLSESSCYGECYYGEFSFECDNYDKIFNKLESEDIFFTVIGAMDGVNHDNTFKYAFKNKHWKGLLIEPMKDYFEKLKENYERRENLIFENVAISDSEGYEYMFRIPSELVESGEVPPWSDGISTFYPEKNVMKEEHLISRAVKEPVLCTTFENISNKHSIEKIDVLQIDVEGCDSNVFWQIWNLNYRPKLIIIEIVNMQSEEKNSIENVLKNNLYTLSYIGGDLVAICKN